MESTVQCRANGQARLCENVLSLVCLHKLRILGAIYSNDIVEYMWFSIVCSK